MQNTPPPKLYDRTDIASEVGFLMMYAANLELTVLNGLAELLRRDIRLALAIIAPIDNLSARLGILLEVAEMKKGRALADMILAKKEDLLAAISFRNRLAHSHFGFEVDTGTMMLMRNALSPGRRGSPRADELHASEIRSHSETIRAFIKAVEQHSSGFLIDRVQETASSGIPLEAIRETKTHQGGLWPLSLKTPPPTSEE